MDLHPDKETFLRTLRLDSNWHDGMLRGIRCLCTAAMEFDDAEQIAALALVKVKALPAPEEEARSFAFVVCINAVLKELRRLNSHCRVVQRTRESASGEKFSTMGAELEVDARDAVAGFIRGLERDATPRDVVTTIFLQALADNATPSRTWMVRKLREHGCPQSTAYWKVSKWIATVRAKFPEFEVD